MNLKKIALGVILLPAFCLSANASKQIMEEMSDHRRTPSTYSFSSQITAYEDLSLEDKYKSNLRSFKQEKKTSLQRMEELALQDNYEEAQLYLAECYRMGVLGRPDVDKAIEMNILALERNNSFLAAVFLGSIFLADGDYEKAKENCLMAKKIASEKNLNASKVDVLLEQIKLDGF